MITRRTTLICLAFCFGLGSSARATGNFSALHEVIRHYQVAFVGRANLEALLFGGLGGLKRAVPSCEISLLATPFRYLVRAKSKTLKIDRTATSSYAGLEKALAQAGKLVEQAGLSKDHRRLEHKMIRGMTECDGDPWTVFLEQSLYSRLLDDGTQKMGDVGLLVEPHAMKLSVLDASPDMPAYKAGIRVGMEVDNVAGRPAGTLEELEALALMRGKIGSRVELQVEGKKYSLERAPEPKRNITVDPPVDGIAVVHLLNFRAGTGDRLSGVMRKLASMGMHAMILDLRGNPGGLLTEGTKVVGLFIGGGKVVSVVGRNHLRTEVEQSPQPGPYRQLPLVVLTDHRSASVSEIVILALRDYGRAKIVGSKTLGKGTVQVIMELIDGSALKISTGRYYSPKGSPLYEGVEPDVNLAWDGNGKDIQLIKAKEIISKLAKRK
jgi:carboxyl-terminal processing protease